MRRSRFPVSFRNRLPLIAGACFVAAAGFTSSAAAAKPTAAAALQLVPVQSDIEYETPSGSDVEECKIESFSRNGKSGWMVYGENGQTLRRFVDSNGDNRVDLWCYYQNGLEVYRDIDANFNEKADQYRWLGPAGSRWGWDDDEDGIIDTWKTISPEEVTAEVVAALREKDAERFNRVLMTAAELKSLGMGTQRQQELTDRLADARREFTKFAGEQRLVQNKSKWIHFGATRPGMLPAGDGGLTKDLLIYDNVAAIIETDGKHGQLIVGTLIQVGSGWRVIDLPSSEASGGFFYTSIVGPDNDVATEGGIDAEMQDLLTELEDVDDQLVSATPTDLAKLNGQRASVLEKLARNASNQNERASWIRQFADTVSAASQSGQYPQGVSRLNSMLSQLKRTTDGNDLIAYVKFRFLTADYSQKMQASDADFAKVQKQWLKNLEDFVKSYPRSEDAAEAMLQLAIAQEFAGKDSDASRWYARIVKDFGSSPLADKAAGAKRRLESVGKPISMQGTSLDGRSINISKYRGRVVLIHYWATWCEPCKQDMKTIKSLQAKFTRDFVPVGVNLDHDKTAVTNYLASNRLPWPQLYEDGGLDSRLANELGVLTLPTMILIDKNGKVSRRNVTAGELQAEIERLTK